MPIHHRFTPDLHHSIPIHPRGRPAPVHHSAMPIHAGPFRSVPVVLTLADWLEDPEENTRLDADDGASCREGPNGNIIPIERKCLGEHTTKHVR
ncbi:hypothetical protein Pelo_4164 [Pelomyxa schiedti]|nr:hypothetical protein Pelo_4164 [Pelomyxa schiedti]